MSIPNNCRECEFNNVCDRAYYGSSNCKHADEINRRAVNEVLKNVDE